MDLARLSGLIPAGVICEIMSDDGTVSRVPQLIEFCREHGLKTVTLADLVRYRLRHERSVRRGGCRIHCLLPANALLGVRVLRPGSRRARRGINTCRRRS